MLTVQWTQAGSRCAWLLAISMALAPWRPPGALQGGSSCSGVVEISTDPKHTSLLDCENPCTDACSAFFVMTPCGEGAQCGCSSVGPNSRPDVALVPASGNGIPCMVGTCPDGDRPEKALGRKRGRRDRDTGRWYYTISIRARCGA